MQINPLNPATLIRAGVIRPGSGPRASSRPSPAGGHLTRPGEIDFVSRFRFDDEVTYAGESVLLRRSTNTAQHARESTWAKRWTLSYRLGILPLSTTPDPRNTHALIPLRRRTIGH